MSFQTIAKVYNWLYDGREGIDKLMAKHVQKKKGGDDMIVKGGYSDGSLLNKYRHHRAIKKLFS